MISKVYFPRLIIPLSSVLGRLFDFGIALLLVFGMMAWFGIAPTLGVLTLPLMARPLIFDGRNIYSPGPMGELGFTYFGVGRPAPTARPVPGPAEALG